LRKITKNLFQDNWCPAINLTWVPPTYIYQFHMLRPAEMSNKENFCFWKRYTVCGDEGTKIRQQNSKPYILSEESFVHPESER
jgi:hypothetical protein